MPRNQSEHSHTNKYTREEKEILFLSIEHNALRKASIFNSEPYPPHNLIFIRIGKDGMAGI